VNQEKYTYACFGLIIESEIELPELYAIEKKSPDVKIRQGNVPKHLPVIYGGGALFEIGPTDFLLRFEKIGSFRVENGKNITVQSFEGTRPEEVRLFILGSVMGALLHQRGVLALHGSAITNGQKSIVVIGKSSVGKSSVAAFFSQKGYEIISDDITAIKFQNGTSLVSPGIPQIKLWRDVIEHLKMGNDLIKIRPDFEKYAKSIRNHYSSSPKLIDTIIHLDTRNTVDYNLSKITGFDKFNCLLSNTYRYQYLIDEDQQKRHFINISHLAKIIDLYKLERPSSQLDLFKLGLFIEKTFFNIG